MIKTLLGVLAALLISVSPVVAQSIVPPQWTTAPASSLTLATSPSSLYGFSVDPGPNAGVAMVFNTTSAPADGPVTPIACYSVKANQTLGISYTPGQIVMTPGATIVFGQDSGLVTHCFNLVKQNAAFISGEAQ